MAILLLCQHSMFSCSPQWLNFIFTYSLEISHQPLSSLSASHDITFFSEKLKQEIQPQNRNQINLLSSTSSPVTMEEISWVFDSKPAPPFVQWISFLSTSVLQLPCLLSFIVHFSHFTGSFIFFLLLFNKFIGMTLVNKIIQVLVYCLVIHLCILYCVYTTQN